jgi:DNA-binding MarR family transcriptional regulator
MDTENLSEKLSATFAEIYYHCHPIFSINLSHQSVRALQFIYLNQEVTVQEVANHIGTAHNTASEILKRLNQRGFIEKVRKQEDERVVIVTITSLGAKTVLEHTGLDVRKLSSILSRLSLEEQAEMLRAFETLNQLVKEESIKE